MCYVFSLRRSREIVKSINIKMQVRGVQKFKEKKSRYKMKIEYDVFLYD